VKAVSTVFNIVCVPPIIRGFGKAQSGIVMLSSVDWKSKENPAENSVTIVLEFALWGSQLHLRGGAQRVLK